MNFKTFRFSLITSLLLVSKEISNGTSKQIQVPDMNLIGNRFADLLNTLVNVNVERVDTLKKLFKLYDVNGGKQMLRTGQYRKDDSQPEIVIIFDNQDQYPEIIHESIVRNNKLLCLCKHTDSDSEEAFYDVFEERAVSRENPYREANLQFHNDKPSTEADQLTFLSVDIRNLSKEKNKSSSIEEVYPTSLKSGKRPLHKSRSCISPERGYEDCKTSCKEAYGNACADYGCSERLYRQLRKECKHACKKRFKLPYGDYD